MQALVDGVQGLVVAPCGAGKTEIGCAAIARVGRSALILVHTLDLATQWQERVKLRWIGELMKFCNLAKSW